MSADPRGPSGTGHDTACDCVSCDEGQPQRMCPESQRECGHHCNHSWSHDGCDWCGATFGEEPVDSCGR